LQTGLVAVTGGERSGKTSYLRRLCGEVVPTPGAAARFDGLPQVQSDAKWVDLSLPGQDDLTPTQWWAAFQEHSPLWNAGLHAELANALGLLPHAHKQLFMLSTGSRRKVAIAALLACGATVTCMDQPYTALDGASIQVLRAFLVDMADHPSRTWVVADYEADKRLPWAQVIALD
jgi:ABC-type transport system involved in cytochrome c biogenesis ATPase subunit